MGVCVPNSGIFFSGCPPLVCRGAQTGPGATQLTRMPSSATCNACAQVYALRLVLELRKRILLRRILQGIEIGHERNLKTRWMPIFRRSLALSFYSARR